MAMLGHQAIAQRGDDGKGRPQHLIVGMTTGIAFHRNIGSQWYMGGQLGFLFGELALGHQILQDALGWRGHEVARHLGA